MDPVANPSRWCPKEAIQRLRATVDRLCPWSVRADASTDFENGHGEVTLPMAVALCDRDAIDPHSEVGRFMLVVGIKNEARKHLHLLAMLAEPAERKKIEQKADAWVDQRLAGVEDEIAAWWGEPVAGLIRQKREEPDLFDRIVSEFDANEESCRDATM